MKSRHFIFSIILLAACQQIETPTPSQPQTPTDSEAAWTLTIQATKSDAATKALSLDGNTLSPYWTNTEKVRVFKAGTYLCQLDVTPGSGEKPGTATLSATNEAFDESLHKDDVLTLLIPKVATNSGDWLYTGQNGVLTGTGSVEDKYDYAIATVTVETKEGNTITTTPASFTNQQSIYRFGFKVGGNTIKPIDFTISSTSGTLVSSRTLSGNEWISTFGSITVTPASADSSLYYVALRNEKNTETDTYNFIITGPGSALYMATINNISAATLTNGFNSAKGIPTTQSDFGPGVAQGTISEASAVL